MEIDKTLQHKSHSTTSKYRIILIENKMTIVKKICLLERIIFR